MFTPGRWQLKTFFTIDKRGSKIDRNSVFDCHLSPVGRQMSIENSVSNHFLSTFVYSIGVFNCRLSCVMFVYLSSQGFGDYTGLPKPSLSADVSNPHVLTHIQIQVKKNIQFCIIELFCHCIATWYAGPPVSCKANGDTCRNQLGSWLDSDTITQKYITYLNKKVFKIKSVARALKYLRKSKGD